MTFNLLETPFVATLAITFSHSKDHDNFKPFYII